MPRLPQPLRLRVAWLLSPEPHPRGWQARLGRAYLGWRAFTATRWR